MTPTERIEIQGRTGWSDAILDALRSVEEAEIYIRAGLKEAVVNGRPALVNPHIVGEAFYSRAQWLKEKLSDYDRWYDYNNADLMGEGYPPRDVNGVSVYAHRGYVANTVKTLTGMDVEED